MERLSSVVLFFLICSNGLFAWELDKKVKKDESGFWGAHYDIPKISMVTVLTMAAYEGTDSRFGKTTWQSLDAGLVSQIITEATKKATGRLRPRNTDSPSDWGEGGKSFFSGHVSGMTALVTPYILEYQEDYPWINLLWVLPLHQMVGRVKAQAHWQSDVFVGALVGFISGYWAHKREYPLVLYFDKDKVVMGIKHVF